MSDIAIRVEGLSKQYFIGKQQERYVALRDVLTRALSTPFRRAASLLRGHAYGAAELHEEIWALKDVSFEVKRGEVVGIIGRNGAGKSTLLKILSRITDPTEGYADVYGRVGALLEVGTGFHPELTGRENVYLNGSILGMKRHEIKQKFDEMVAFAEVEKFIDTPVKHYSSGMQVRLAFAVAAHLEPEILVVDEVLAVGDAAFQKKCLGKMGDVTKEGRTVLFVSHNMPSIQSLCQRVVLLQKGVLRMDGFPEHVVSHYLSEGVDTELAEVDLTEHIGRARFKEHALRRAWFLNADDMRTNVIGMGDSLKICFEFQCSRKIVNPGFGFVIEDHQGKILFSLNNYVVDTGETYPRDAQKGIACAEFPHIPLAPGLYFVTLSFVEDNKEWIDRIERAVAFHVEPADVYGSGKIFEHSNGSFFVLGSVHFHSEGKAV
ncbi:MAG: ABC transporter ATP-binding protein [Chloroflexaceae bacterium]|nr:ABC transporter ATP-binding protein [Chloroflexaceae bacterium]